ncbi:MAG: 2-C-methyl-D-erythritol 2,4-cyclodiphosphate synthase [Anaerorhabdus sp.]
MIRIGQSTDIHKLVENEELILGGVKIEYHKGLQGHSDADVLVHAICEAIIGALALNDLGSLFPDNDPKYKGISSLILLEDVYKKMCEMQFSVGNIDSLIIIEKPKLRGYIEKMRENIARVLHCDLSKINIKATTSEKLGFVGREEGVIAQAVCLIESVE